MSIWVLSQDKQSLVNCNGFRISKHGRKNEWKIYSLTLDDLGTYFSEEKAANVLKELTLWINSKYESVYAMPSDEYA